MKVDPVAEVRAAFADFRRVVKAQREAARAWQTVLARCDQGMQEIEAMLRRQGYMQEDGETGEDQ